MKVFPYEYQKALQKFALSRQPAANKSEPNGQAENGIADIEEAIRDVELDKKNLEKILDKTR